MSTQRLLHERIDTDSKPVGISCSIIMPICVCVLTLEHTCYVSQIARIQLLSSTINRFRCRCFSLDACGRCRYTYHLQRQDKTSMRKHIQMPASCFISRRQRLHYRLYCPYKKLHWCAKNDGERYSLSLQPEDVPLFYKPISFDLVALLVFNGASAYVLSTTFLYAQVMDALNSHPW